MSSAKPIIFVSHAARDVEIANRFKIDLEKHFLGLCDVFVSSNLDSINPGDEWVEQIKYSLANCSMMIGLISPTAISRGWIYFEFGAAWLKNIPVVPVCHSGLSRNTLVPPLSLFQAIDLSDELHLTYLYGMIAKTIGCTAPALDFKEISQKYFDITEVNRAHDLLKNWIMQLIQWNPRLDDIIDGKIDELQINIPPNFDAPFAEFRQLAHTRELLIIDPGGMALGTPVGAFASVYRVAKSTRTSEIRTLLSQ